MSRPQHTPGPWAVIADVPGSNVGYRAIVMNDDGEPGELICNPSPMGDANARLIAAAPELLAALDKIHAAASRSIDFGDTETLRDFITQIAAASRAAIAKATGAA